MAVDLPQGIDLRYSLSGGAPPATLEVLTITDDAAGVYLCGSSWPGQPPFDEIGWYEQTLLPALWDDIRAAMPGADAALTETTHADAGRESFTLRDHDRIVTCTTSPGRTPPAWQRLRARLRGAIVWLRAHPACTVRAELHAASKPYLTVRLHNRGERRFAIAGGTGAEPELHVALRKEGQDARALPEWLVSQEALPPTGGIEAAAVEPGGWRNLQFAATAAAQDLFYSASRDQPIDGLLRLCFPRVGDTGQAFLQEGWLWIPPAAITPWGGLFGGAPVAPDEGDQTSLGPEKPGQ